MDWRMATTIVGCRWLVMSILQDSMSDLAALGGGDAERGWADGWRWNRLQCSDGRETMDWFQPRLIVGVTLSGDHHGALNDQRWSNVKVAPRGRRLPWRNGDACPGR